MGTTGGNQEALARAALEGGVMAVIAPQLGKQVRGEGRGGCVRAGTPAAAAADPLCRSGCRGVRCML